MHGRGKPGRLRIGEDPFRPPWEDEAPPRASRVLAGSEALLIPLARAQDAVARLEAAVDAAQADVAPACAPGFARFEAAGYLVHHGVPVHPHDLALREANLTGSYTVAAMWHRASDTDRAIVWGPDRARRLLARGTLTGGES